MSRKNKVKDSGSVTVVFQKKWGGLSWAKTFKSQTSAMRAAKGIVTKTNNVFVAAKKAKGFKYGALLKRVNRNK